MTVISLATGEKLGALPRGCAVALGFFDGVHLGHRAILDTAKKEAERLGGASAVWMLSHFKKTRLLTSEAEKLRAIADCGIDYAVICEFSDISSLSGEQFVRCVLSEELGALSCVCGFNFRFGKGAAWGTDDLKRFCTEYGMAQVTVPAVTYGGESVSSTRIRELITTGELSLASAMLGRPFSMSLPVLGGKKLGRRLGFPTANQIPPQNRVCPPRGVYATAVQIEQAGSVKLCAGCSNVGVCPTVTEETLRYYGADADGDGAAWGEKIAVETYVDGFSGDLYGRELKVSFLACIRGEKCFDSIDALRHQIARDIDTAIEVFNDYVKNGGGSEND